MSAMEYLLKKQEQLGTNDVPFWSYHDLRGYDFNKLPDIIHETQNFKDIQNSDKIHVIVGSRGSGKSLLLKFEEHFLLESILDEDHKGLRTLSIPFDMGAEGFESKNLSDYNNETAFHFELLNAIIERIKIQLQNLNKLSMKGKFKFWRAGKRAKEPTIKHITKGKGKISLEFLQNLSFSVNKGNEMVYVQKKCFQPNP